MSSRTDIMPPDVAAVFESYPDNIYRQLMKIRALIFETAASIDGVGPLTETLKWREPSYLTNASKSGSTIRIAYSDKRPGQYGIYFNCKTTLLDTFRTLFPNTFSYAGDRAIIFKSGETYNSDALAICISKALTYHRDK